MIGLKKRVLLRPYILPDMTITTVAGKIGVGRRTVHRWIEQGRLDRDLSPNPILNHWPQLCGPPPLA